MACLCSCKFLTCGLGKKWAILFVIFALIAQNLFNYIKLNTPNAYLQLARALPGESGCLFSENSSLLVCNGHTEQLHVYGFCFSGIGKDVSVMQLPSNWTIEPVRATSSMFLLDQDGIPRFEYEIPRPPGPKCYLDHLARDWQIDAALLMIHKSKEGKKYTRSMFY